MFNINSNVKCGVFINGREFLLDNGNVMQSLHISASSLYKLPTLNIHLVDALNLMPNFGLQDGVPVSVVLDGVYLYTRNFRVLRWRSQLFGNGSIYSIDCIWDAPKYWSGTDCAGLTGTSSDVLTRIAQLCGLSVYPNNARTSDSMTWMQNNQAYSTFAREIARHGFVSNESHMMLAVDSVGFLRYLNLNDLKAQKIKVSTTPPDSGESALLLSDFAPVAASGVSNAMGGTRALWYAQQGDASSTITPEEKDVTLKSDAQYPLVNSKVRSIADRGPVVYSPINYGNVHPNYERARYQNIRFNLLKSLSGQFLLPFQTPLEPGNQIVFSQAAGLKSSIYNGEYTITDKIIYVAGAQYNEKLIGVKNGLSE